MRSHTDHDHEATRRFYDRISGAYDLISDAGEAAARRRGIELLAVRPGERVAEIGYGTGHALEALALAVGPTGRVAGIDISDGMRREADRRLERAALTERVELQVGVAPPLPWPDDEFDAVFMSFTLELFPDDVIPALLGEVARVLRPAGRLGVVAMAEPPPGHRLNPLERAYRFMHQHFPHIVDCRPLEVADTLTAGGFKVAESASFDIWTLPVTAAVARRRA